MRTVSGKRLAKILRGRGWAHVSTKGSHHKYRSPDGGTTVIIPIHGNEDLPKGLQFDLMKDAGLTERDL